MYNSWKRLYTDEMIIGLGYSILISRMTKVKGCVISRIPWLRMNIQSKILIFHIKKAEHNYCFITHFQLHIREDDLFNQIIQNLPTTLKSIRRSKSE